MNHLNHDSVLHILEVQHQYIINVNYKGWIVLSSIGYNQAGKHIYRINQYKFPTKNLRLISGTRGHVHFRNILAKIKHRISGLLESYSDIMAHIKRRTSPICKGFLPIINVYSTVSLNSSQIQVGLCSYGIRNYKSPLLTHTSNLFNGHPMPSFNNHDHQ